MTSTPNALTNVYAMYRLLLLLTIFALTACETAPPSDSPASGPDDTSPPAPDTTVQTPDQHQDGSSTSPGVGLQTLLDRASERDAEGRLVVLDEMNAPQDVEMDTQENRHYPARTDTLQTLHYEDLSLTVHHVAGGKELLKSVTVSGGDYRTSEGLHVGMTRSGLEDVMGSPTERRSGTYVYVLEGPMPPHLAVEFEGDEVSRLRWNFPID